MPARGDLPGPRGGLQVGPQRTASQLTGPCCRCECALGWAGLNCEDDVDECAASPCQNSGACKETGSSYTCTCQVHSSDIHILHSQLLVYCEQAGYEGKNCEVNTNDCARSPCAAGGTCTDLVAGFSCSCPPGTTGDTCAEQIGRYLRENFNIKRYYEISDSPFTFQTSLTLDVSLY